MVTDAGERRDSRSGDAIEAVRRIAQALGQLAAELEMELGARVESYTPVHGLDRILELKRIDDGLDGHAHR